MASLLLALREIRRARVRFGLLTGAIGLLAFLILFQQTLLTSLITQFIGALRNQSADVLVYGDDARRNVEGSVVTPEQLDDVRSVPGVARAERLGEGTFTVTAGDELRDAVIFGYRLDGPGRPDDVSSGRLPERDGEAVASSLDADRGFGIGDRVKVEPDGPEIVVVGLARDLRFSVSPTMFVSYATYEEARLTANPDARAVLPSLVAVEAGVGIDADVLARRITTTVAGVEALDRDAAARESPGVSAVQQSVGVVLLLAYVIVTMVTGFFFLILTVQKASALTLLRAVGAPAAYLVRALLAQVVLVVGVAVVVAAVLLAIVARVFGGGLEVTIEPRSVGLTGAVLLALAALASLGAARRLLRIDPIRATTGAPLGGA